VHQTTGRGGAGGPGRPSGRRRDIAAMATSRGPFRACLAGRQVFQASG
jgi:hypothetical protein